jgi:hypothetical protein
LSRAECGGVCSMILAALADRHVPAGEPIDLPTVCFADGTSPDRQSALQVQPRHTRTESDTNLHA